MFAIKRGQVPPAAPGWTAKLVQRLKTRTAPKGLRTALPARCSAEPLPQNPTKTALRSLPQDRLRQELQARGLEAAGRKPALVERLHAALATQPATGVSAQRGSTINGRPAAANPELMRLRERVAALDAELEAVQASLEQVNATRESERQQLAALQEEVGELQAGWAADRAALQDAVDSARTLADSQEEVRELQAQTVQFSERVVKLQTLVKAQNEKVADLKRRLAAATPAYAMAGAGPATMSTPAGGSGPTLDQLFAGLGGGEMLTGESFGGIGGAEAATSAATAPVSWPLGGVPRAAPGFRSDILQQPGALGVAMAAGALSAADAAGGVWSTVRRLAPAEQRRALDVAALAAVGGAAVAAAWAVAQ